MRLQRIAAVLLAGLSLLSASAWALKAGDNTVAIGVAYVNPNVSADALNYGGTQVLGPLPISSASASSTTTGALILGHMFTDNIALVLDIGFPPKINFSMAQQTLTKGVSTEVASVKLWAPMLVGRYYFLDAKNAFRPYLGAGVVYTAFNSLTLNTAGQSLAPTGASIDSAWGWVASLGANYELNSNYFLTGSLSYTYTTTTLHINNLVGAVGPSSTNLKLGNTLVFFGAGYRF